MSAMNLLEQLLKSGASMIDQAGSSASSMTRGANRAPFTAGAVTGGALALLLGSRRGRQVGGKVLKYGSIAALGVLAYNAYTRWQAQQSAAQPGAPAPQPAQTIERLPAPQAEQHSQALLKAMIAAAKSDGHMDERERGLVDAEMQRLQAEPALRRWVDEELRRPIDPADVAAAADSPELAAEIYLATLLVVDETTTMERAYLDELARQLKLPDSLKSELEAQAQAA